MVPTRFSPEPLLIFTLQEFLDSDRVVKSSIGNTVSSPAITTCSVRWVPDLAGWLLPKVCKCLCNHNVVHLELI